MTPETRARLAQLHQERKDADEAFIRADSQSGAVRDAQIRYRTAVNRFEEAAYDALPDLLDAARRLEAAIRVIDMEIKCTPPSRQHVVLPILRSLRALLDAPASPGREREGTTHG